MEIAPQLPGCGISLIQRQINDPVLWELPLKFFSIKIRVTKSVLQKYGPGKWSRKLFYPSPDCLDFCRSDISALFPQCVTLQT